MAFDYERLLVSKILYSEDIAPLVNRKIDERILQDGQSKKALKFILDFHKEYVGAIPSIELFAEEFGDYNLSYAKDPHDFYINKVVENYMSVSTQEAIMEWIDEIVRNPNEGLAGLRTDLTSIELDTNPTLDTNMSEDIDDRKQRYIDRKECGGIDGLHTPWETLTEVTSGIHDGESWAIVGRPSTGKTFLFSMFASKIHQQGKSVLVVTKEMPAPQMERRFDSVHFKLPFARFKNGMLTDKEEADYFTGLEDMESTDAKVYITSADSISAIINKAIQYDVDGILIDGAYLLRDDMRGKNDWERMTNISRGIKQLCLTLGKFAIHTWQFNRSGSGKNVGLENIGLTDAVGQDADVAIGLVMTKDMAQNYEREVEIMKCREGETGNFRIEFDFDNMSFEELEDMGVHYEDDKTDELVF